jgi:acyl dehydratase
MIGHGVYFDDYKVGATYQTLGRTISETDIVNFVNLGGFTEPLFMDMEYVKKESLYGTRMAPGAMTLTMSEGLVMQTGMIHGVGMAWLGGEVKVTAPVLAGDTIRVEVEIAGKRETKKPDRGIQRGETVMELTLQRMIKRKQG